MVIKYQWTCFWAARDVPESRVDGVLVVVVDWWLERRCHMIPARSGDDVEKTAVQRTSPLRRASRLVHAGSVG